MTKNSTISQFLSERLSAYSAKSELARRLGKSEATVSRWADGKVRPDFLSCIQIAQHFDLDPGEVMEMSGLPGSEVEVFRRCFPDYQPRRRYISEDDLYPDPKHRELHRWLQDLLDSGMHDTVRETLDRLWVPVIQVRRVLAEIVERTKARACYALAGGREFHHSGAVTEEEAAQMRLGEEIEGWTRFEKRGPHLKSMLLYLKVDEMPEQMGEDIIPMLMRIAAGQLYRYPEE